jgi:hypothetical protein
MEDVGAKPTLYGTVLMKIIENGQQKQFELTIELARKLRSQLEASLRGGPGCLDRISASISGASAGVRLPCGEAAG